MPCWGIANSNPEKDPIDVDRTPEGGWAIYSASRWCRNECADYGKQKGKTITLVDVPGSAMSEAIYRTLGHIYWDQTYHEMVFPFQSLELLGVVLAE